MSDSKERIQREIEAKKKKLEELKKKRAAGTTVETPVPVPASTSTDNLPSAEELLSSISSLIPPSSDTSSSSHSSSSSAQSTPARPPSASASSRLSSLANVKGPTVDITPTERIFYEVAVQADIAGPTTSTAASVVGDDKGEEGEGWIAKEAELQSLIQQLKDENKSLKGGKDGVDGKDGEENIRELKASEREEILSSVEFQNFFSRSSLMLERALSIQENQYDFTVNYSEAGEEKEEDGQAKGEAKLRQKFVFTDPHHSAGRAVTSIDWSPKYKELILSSYAARDDPSSSTSADGVASALGDPDGTVLVWNMHLNNRPEYVFHCSSAVLSATFHPTHPRLIIGACWSGQIVIWDTREKSTPIARSSLAHGHTQPVHSMSLHSPPHLSGLAHLITMSQDGQLCVWEENNLHKPIHENLLRIAPPQNAANAPFSALSQVATLKDEISAYAFDFPGRDPSTLLLASDEGHIYKAKIYEKDGIYETVSAHEAPITAIQFHPMHKSNNSGIQLSASAPTADIFLTSSYDWTIKLWSNKLTSSLSAAQASFPSSTSSSPSVPISVAPLISIENGRDYVYDVRWHPKTPYLFASVDGSGTIDLYNILDDNHDVPAYSIQIGDQLDKIFQEQTFAAEGLEGEAVEGLSTSSSSAREPRALSRLRWSDDGRQLACGTSVGSLHVLELASDYCEASRESINNFYEKINKLHSQAQTANLLNSSPSTAFSAQV